MKPAKKRTRILFLCILFCFVLYQILFPVRTLREVLEAREIYNLSDSYERKEYEDTYVLPDALPGLQQDVLGVRGTLPSFYDFELLSSQDTGTNIGFGFPGSATSKLHCVRRSFALKQVPPSATGPKSSMYTI